MALTPVDRKLVQRCLDHEPGAWNDFVDRFLGIIYHVVAYTAHLRSVPIRPEDVEDIAAEVLLRVVANDYGVLRQFRGNSSLATYLTVIARRICVHELTRRASAPNARSSGKIQALPQSEARPIRVSQEDIEEVHKLLKLLPPKEREIVRMHYLEGRSYEEISTALNIPVNSIGPVLSRAKKKMQERNDVTAPMPALPSTAKPTKKQSAPPASEKS
jgi:RNA polymerase sigma-70 factor (ECF subfamily)